MAEPAYAATAVDGFQFIDELFPLVIVVNPPDGMSDEALSGMEESYRELWSRGARYAVIIKPHPKAPATNAKERKRVIDWVNQPVVAANARRYCVGSAVVTSNAVFRGALTALLWFWKPPFPLAFSASDRDAASSMVEALRADGAALPYTGEGTIERAVSLIEDAVS